MIECNWCKTKIECPQCGHITKKDKQAMTIKTRKVINGRPRKWDYDKLRMLRKQGMSLNAIAKKVGCPRTSVRAAISAIQRAIK